LEEKETARMCLAIPSKITEINNNIAIIDVDGVQREASLMLLADAQVGDYVIVHAGFAIQKLDEAAALDTLNLLRSAADAYDEQFKKPQ
jgi:hydrogenase expression/formation protein HypC